MESFYNPSCHWMSVELWTKSWPGFIALLHLRHKQLSNSIFPNQGWSYRLICNDVNLSFRRDIEFLQNLGIWSLSEHINHLETWNKSSFSNPSLTGLRNLIYSKSPRINQRTLILQVHVILITEGRNGVILWPSSSNFCAESGRRMARNWDRTC
jgi:hypothetical protein